jgi:hypothetical protein
MSSLLGVWSLAGALVVFKWQAGSREEPSKAAVARVVAALPRLSKDERN